MSKYQSIDFDHYGRVFKALSNPNRLKILVYFMSCCDPGSVCRSGGPRCCVGELGALLSVAPSTLSHHLKELHRAGLINMRRRGQQVECWLETEKVDALREFFNLSAGKVITRPAQADCGGRDETE